MNKQGTRRQHKGWALKLLCASFSLTLCACSVSQTPHGFQVQHEYNLASALIESSGLYCLDNQAVTLNDSGNKPELYTLNHEGKLIATLPIDAENHDWEALTADEAFFYVGDFGNNRGKRTNLEIIKVRRDDGTVAQHLAVTYKANNVDANVAYDHDYDAEAMVAQGEHLWLISKSWHSRIAHVYAINKLSDNQNLEPQYEIEGLPGVVTGIDWDARQNRFVVVGYTSNSIGIFNPFIATLSDQFTVTSVQSLPQFAQVEGICAQANGDIWITQESSPFQNARMAVLQQP